MKHQPGDVVRVRIKTFGPEFREGLILRQDPPARYLVSVNDLPERLKQWWVMEDCIENSQSLPPAGPPVRPGLRRMIVD